MADNTNNKTSDNETEITATEEGGQTKTPENTIVNYKVEFNQRENWIELKGKTESLEKQTSKIEEKIDRFDEKIKDSNLKTIETLGIFVALFTFISLETQILRSGISFVTAIGFSLIMLGGLLVFLSALHFFVSEENNTLSKSIILLSISTLFIIGGLEMVFKGENDFYQNLDDKYYNKDQIGNIVSSSTEKSLNEFKQCVLYNGGYWSCLNISQ